MMERSGISGTVHLIVRRCQYRFWVWAHGVCMDHWRAMYGRGMYCYHKWQQAKADIAPNMKVEVPK